MSETSAPTKKPILSDLQDENEDYEIVIDETTGERMGLITLQGQLMRVPLDRPVRVYADGIYDCFHFGHARSLKQAKNLFYNTELVVGCCGDEVTHRLKGKTVMNEQERYECVRHCKWADEVLEDAPWIVTTEYMAKHRIDFVSHGEDLSVDEFGNDVYQHIKDMKKFLTIKRTDGISTTDLIMRIVKDYDKYVRRNLSRGYSRHDMNVGLIKAQQIKIAQKWDQYVNKWKNVSDKLLMNFTKVFTNPKSEEELLTLADFESGISSPSEDTEELEDEKQVSPVPVMLFAAVTIAILKYGK